MKLRPLLIVGGAIVLAMLALAAWAWPQIPADARIPIHWGPSGEPDGYGDKWLGLLGLPLVGVALLALLALLPRIEPRRANLQRSGTAYVAIAIAAMGLLGGFHAFAVLAALGSEGNIGPVVAIGAGALLVVIGNYLGKTRSNWFFGIRTPWTLASDRSWSRTHRLGGQLFVALGLLTLAVTVLLDPMIATWVMLGGLALAVAWLVAYSYMAWRDDPNREAGGAGEASR